MGNNSTESKVHLYKFYTRKEFNEKENDKINKEIEKYYLYSLEFYRTQNNIILH